MVFQTRETDDGNFELILDAEGIDYLEDGLTELRHMQSGEAVATPSITKEGVSEFMLKRAEDA
jgi:hypothetical protein